ncbi:MAG: hypothetical protein Q8898_14170 [Bacillota bacterium]|nr:hypothetical protein [Bacillota bacterium]
MVYDQFIHLNIRIDHAGFVVDYKPRGDWHFWIPDQHEVPSKITHPRFDSVWANQFDEAKEKGINFFATHLNFEEKNKFYQGLLSLIPGLTEEVKEFYFNCPGLAGSTVLLDNVGLYIENFDGIPYTDEENNTLMRFGKVFQQTYTRFLDLQKAEAQAREAQIQLALERIRARTMAMQKQNDLLGVLDLLVEQLVKLGVNLQVADFSNGITGRDWDLWIEVAADDGTIFNNYVHFPRIDHPYFHHVEKNIETFRTDGTDLFKDVFSKEEKDSWQDYINTQTIYRDLTSEEIKQSMYEKSGYAWSMVILKDTWVSICRFNTIPFSDEEDALLKRFANAFGQTYTRFLDLQKAEAQSRESQIQLALERVRAGTMAMQRSDELADAASLLFKQVSDLGIKAWSTAFQIWNPDNISTTAWASAPDGSIQTPFRLPYDEDIFFKQIYEARQRGEEYFVMESSGKELEKTYKYMFNLPGVKKYFDDAEDSGF